MSSFLTKKNFVLYFSVHILKIQYQISMSRVPGSSKPDCLCVCFLTYLMFYDNYMITLIR